MRRFLFALPLVLGACATTPEAAEDEPEAAPAAEEQVLEVIRGLFEGMRQVDTAAIRRAFHPEARLVATGQRDGQPTVQIVSVDRFITSIAESRGYLDERIFDPVVHVDGNLAQVWTFYRFDLAGNFSHCGFDAFQLVRTDEGWRIINVADTRHRDPDVCAELAQRNGDRRATR